MWDQTHNHESLGVVAIVTVIGLFVSPVAGALMFSDLAPGESVLLRVAIVAAVLVTGGFLVGLVAQLYRVWHRSVLGSPFPWVF